MEDTKSGAHAVEYSTYVLVWLALMVLLALTVAVAGLGLGTANILTVLVIAGAKSALVLYYFMHLKYEGFLIRLIFLAAPAVLVIIIAMTYLEVLQR